MDESVVRRTEDQLAAWGDEIKRREARLATPGREPRFTAVLHVDELRVLLVTARARFEALQADPAGDWDLPTVGFDDAWEDLAAAIGRPMPRP